MDFILLPFAILFAMLTIMGVTGNLIVIIAIASDRKMRNTGLNILLLNLAAADLCNLILTTFEWIQIVITLKPGVWFLPHFLCAICRYFEYVFIFTSISTQIIVSIERYIAIIHPIHARRYCTRRNAVLAISAAWCLVAGFTWPYAYYHEAVVHENVTYCKNRAALEKWWDNYKQAEFLAFYLIPCLIIIYVYSRIVRCLWASNPQLLEHNRRLTNCKKNDQLRTRRNVVKMLLTCVAVYFLCYSPIQVIFISRIIFPAQYNVPFVCILIFNALAMTCSAANPLLYTLFSMRFRRKLHSLFICNSYRRIPIRTSTRVRESRIFVTNTSE